MQWSRNMVHSPFTRCLRVRDYLNRRSQHPWYVRPLDERVTGPHHYKVTGSWLVCEVALRCHAAAAAKWLGVPVPLQHISHKVEDVVVGILKRRTEEAQRDDTPMDSGGMHVSPALGIHTGNVASTQQFWVPKKKKLALHYYVVVWSISLIEGSASKLMEIASWELATKGVTTQTAVKSHLCVMIGASVALSQSQHVGVSHYLPVWLRPYL